VVVAIPTLSTWGAAILAVLLSGAALTVLTRRH
jgi:hypothetical protein